VQFFGNFLGKTFVDSVQCGGCTGRALQALIACRVEYEREACHCELKPPLPFTNMGVRCLPDSEPPAETPSHLTWVVTHSPGKRKERQSIILAFGLNAHPHTAFRVSESKTKSSGGEGVGVWF
jgi:hypothetical protein